MSGKPLQGQHQYKLSFKTGVHQKSNKAKRQKEKQQWKTENQ